MNSNKQISQSEHSENTHKSTHESARKNNNQNEPMAKSDEQVTYDYLSSHPDFFQANAELLEKLTLKHSSGKAVSLIERQVEQLRRQNNQLKNQLSSLINIAKENEKFTDKMQTLVQDLLACHDIQGIDNVLQHRITTEFAADLVALRLFSPQAPVGHKHIALDKEDTQAKELLKIVHKREPECGFFKGLDLQQLFLETNHQVGSMAVVPLFIDKNHCFGVLVLGSSDISHFNPNMGTIFLQNLSQVLSHAIYKYLKQAK